MLRPILGAILEKLGKSPNMSGAKRQKISIAVGIMLSIYCEASEAMERAELRAYTPQFEVPMLSTERRPKMDGKIDDLVWEQAAIIENDMLYQVDPVEGARPTEPSTLRIYHDNEQLYFAIEAFDSEPDKILASAMARDGDIYKGDFVRIILDPYKSEKNGYVFEINPLGSRVDHLIENNSRFITEWDTIWYGAAEITDKGWTAEIAIPFRSLSFDPNRTRWGFDFVRIIRRKDERIRWSAISQSIGFADVSHIGSLTNLSPSVAGRGIELQGFLSSRWNRNSENGSTSDDFEIRPSGIARFHVTPSLVTTLTVNTDFSDTPLDERRINIDRFALYFPETRDFFLQDASLFEFGGNSFDDNPNGRPFFSRRIGLYGGETRDIIAGAKLSGRAGNLSIGALSTVIDGVDGENSSIASIARLSYQMAEGANLGAIFTHSSPANVSDDILIGGDFQYRTRSLMGLGLVVFDAYYAYNLNLENPKNGSSYGAVLAYPNDRHDFEIGYKFISDDYSPEIGFINRPGIGRWFGRYRYRHRPGKGFFRYMDVGTEVTRIHNEAGLTESKNYSPFLNLLATSQDALSASLGFYNELVTAPFPIADGPIVLPGNYSYKQLRATITTSPARRVDGAISITCCELYDGRFLELNGSVSTRLSNRLSAKFSYTRQNIDFSTGGITINIASADIDIYLSPDAQITTQVQYDDISDVITIFSRLRWEFTPGSEVFVAAGHARQPLLHPSTNHFSSTDALIRIGHTMRF